MFHTYINTTNGIIIQFKTVIASAHVAAKGIGASSIGANVHHCVTFIDIFQDPCIRIRLISWSSGTYDLVFWCSWGRTLKWWRNVNKELIQFSIVYHFTSLQESGPQALPVFEQQHADLNTDWPIVFWQIGEPL